MSTRPEASQADLAPLVEAAYPVRHDNKYLSLAVAKNIVPQRAAKAA